MITLSGFVWAVWGCAQEEAEVGRQLLGSVSAYGEHFEVWDGSAYFYADDERMVLYVNQAEALSCSQTAAVITRSSSDSAEEWDPDVAMAPGYCTLTLTTGPYSGELSVSLAEGDSTTDAVISLYCPLPGGEWAEDGDGWTFTGAVWEGRPTAYELEVEGIEGAGEFSVSMESYSGSDPNIFGSSFPGTGSVEGSGNVEWCPDFASTPLFP